MRFRVGMLQMASLGVDQAANLDKAERFCRRAKDLDVDLALFPEMYNVGYTLHGDDPALTLITNGIGPRGHRRKDSHQLGGDLDAAFRFGMEPLSTALAVDHAASPGDGAAH